MRFYDDFTVLIFEDRLSFSPITVIKVSDGKTTFYCVPKIHRLLETKTHSRRQPTNLSADLSEYADNQEPVTNPAMKILYLCKPMIKMHGVIVSADVRKRNHILFREGACNGKRVASLQPCNRFFPDV
jgi:hypothetical protein